MRNLILVLLVCVGLTADAGQRWQRTANGFVMGGRQYVLGVDDYCCGKASCRMQQELWAAFRRAQSASSQHQAQKILQGVQRSFAPSPKSMLDALWKVIRPKANQVVMDPGCGDARVLIEASRRFGAYGMGLELTPKPASLAKSNIPNAGYSKRISITQGDCRKYKFSKADYVFLYLYDDLVRELVPKLKRQLKQGAVVVSYQHVLPLPGSSKVTVNDHTFCVWQQY